MKTNFNNNCSWAQHEISLWNSPELSATPLTDGSRKRSQDKGINPKPMLTAEDACGRAIRLSESLRLIGKVETVVCAPTCDFFENRSELIKPRDMAFKTTVQSQNIRWIFPIRRLENVDPMLPKNWSIFGWPNICFLLESGTDDEEFLAKIEKFRNIPAVYRMLHVGPRSQSLNLTGKLRGIAWVVYDGGPLPPDGTNDPAVAIARALKDACEEAGTAFYYHRDGVAADLDGRIWQEHPFGHELDLTRPPLPGSEKLLPPPQTCAAKPAVPVERSAKPKPKAANAVEVSTDPEVQTPPPATSVQPDDCPGVLANPSPEDLVAATTGPELSAIPAKPKRTKRTGKVTPKRVEEAAVNASGTCVDVLAEPVPAGEIAADGSDDSGPGNNAGDEDMEFEVLPRKKSPKPLGNSKAGGRSLADPDAADFKRLHGIVVRCAGLVFDAGNALAEIRSRKLWRAGGFASWNAYCAGVQGITKRHANHLIATAEVVGVMREVGKKSPTSSEIAPQIPSQVSPLLRIKDECRRNEAWSTAVERSGGQQPKPKIVAQVVAEILEDFDKPASPSPKQSRATLRAEVFARMKVAATARKDWNLIEKLVEELGDVL